MMGRGGRWAALALPLLLACGTRAARVDDFPMQGFQLVDQEGRSVRLDGPFAPGKAVVLTFMYTTCTTVCPEVGASLADLQAQLGEASGKVRLVSVTLDPANDTPQAMKDYLGRFRARPGWDFYTGSPDELRRLRRTFTQHVPGEGPIMPAYFLRSPRDGKWVRLAGRMSPSEFLAACRKEGIL